MAFELGWTLLLGLGFLLGSHLARAFAPARWKAPAFALLNLACVYFIFKLPDPGRLRGWLANFHVFDVCFVVYLLFVGFQFVVVTRCAKQARWMPWIPFLLPIGFLALVKYYYPPEDNPFAPCFIGLSYMAFRMSYLVLEIRNGVVEAPEFWDYLGFCFFLPTMAVGPINPYQKHIESLRAPDRTQTPIPRSIHRVLIGAAKCLFLGNLANQISYRSLLIDGHFHPPIDLLIAAIAYYFYLYWNFSGFCDIAIGSAGILGVQVEENFDRPLLARNIREFWNKWHMTLSTYMRDVVFSPLAKTLTGILGPNNLNHAIAITLFVVFLLVGIWHGAGMNFALFGAFHATGMVVHHYYSLLLKSSLGKEGFRAYNESRVIRCLATALTFGFIVVGFFFFANSCAQMESLLTKPRWGINLW